ncbi:MAG: ribosome biogenesis GTPase Der, partial [Deltaproteobacteria bacterium]|nr:ribosome biogenesis GTPase Der [Deltaproteobacteria bacterium]
YELGVGDVEPVSAEHGLGTIELLYRVIDLLGEDVEEISDEDIIRVAIVGRPNAGKSSLLNKLIGSERAIVSDVAGTTRDSIDTVFEHNGKRYLFIDTAGIRKKSKVNQEIEAYAVMDAIRCIERSHVVLLVIDAEAGPSTQDEKIAGLIDDRSRCVSVIVNKWDLIEKKETNTAKDYTERVHSEMPFLSFAPVMYLSALTGQRVEKVFTMIDGLREQASKKIKTSVLNEAMTKITRAHRHPVFAGHEVKFYYATQTATMPPRFTIFSNYPEQVEDSYLRYMVNRLREELGLEDVPIRMTIRQRER